MLLSATIGLGVLAAIVLHHLCVAERRFIVGPESFFIILGTGTFAATLHAAVAAGYESHPYVNYIGFGLLLFILGTFTSRVLLGFSHRRALELFRGRPWEDDYGRLHSQVALAIGWLALAISAAYYWALGFFLPFEALRAFLSGGLQPMYDVYRELRRATYATGAYLAPGYVYQFKNVLLSVMTILLYYRMRMRPRASGIALFGLFATAAALAATGAGRRFPLAFLAAAFLLIGLARYMAPFRLRPGRAVALGLIALVVLSSMTLMMGSRGSQKIVDNELLWAPLQLFDRVVRAPAEERFLAFEIFLEDQEPLWGGGTLRQLAVLLPGRSDYTLSNELHEILYGSPTGNLGLDLWGSTWYDFHWYGLLVVFLFGLVCNAYYVWLLRGPKTLIRVVTLAYAGLLLGLATDLGALINTGFLTCLIFLACIGLAKMVEGVVGREPPRDERLLAQDAL